MVRGTQVLRMTPQVSLLNTYLIKITYRPFFVTIISLVRHWNLVQRSRSSRVTCKSRSVGSPLQRPAVSSDSTADRMCDCAIPETQNAELQFELHRKFLQHFDTPTTLLR